MEHETDYQRTRRQRHEVKEHGITGSTPHDAAKRIKAHVSAKSKALHKAMGHVNLPHVGMGGKYKGMEFIRGARGKATYLGMKRSKLHEEKEPTSFAKSVRRHQEK